MASRRPSGRGSDFAWVKHDIIAGPVFCRKVPRSGVLLKDLLDIPRDDWALRLSPSVESDSTRFWGVV